MAKNIGWQKRLKTEFFLVLQQKKSRAIIPKTLSLIILSVIFYFGILLNISLLNLTAAEETLLKTGSLFLLLGIIIVGIILAIIKAHTPYLFYKDRIMFGKKSILYREIATTAPTKNSVDKLFKTYSLLLHKLFPMRNIPEDVDIKSYVEQMMGYSRNLENK